MTSTVYLVHLLNSRELHTTIIHFNINKSEICVTRMVDLRAAVNHIVALLSSESATSWPIENDGM
jgi:hypothetical protein